MLSNIILIFTFFYIYNPTSFCRLSLQFRLKSTSIRIIMSSLFSQAMSMNRLYLYFKSSKTTTCPRFDCTHVMPYAREKLQKHRTSFMISAIIKVMALHIFYLLHCMFSLKHWNYFYSYRCLILKMVTNPFTHFASVDTIFQLNLFRTIPTLPYFFGDIFIFFPCFRNSSHA